MLKLIFIKYQFVIVTILLLQLVNCFPKISEEKVTTSPSTTFTGLRSFPSSTSATPTTTTPTKDRQASSTTHKETTVDLIRSHGYPAELHHVVTNDGYILGIHRIPHGRVSGRGRGRGYRRDFGCHSGRSDDVIEEVKRPVVFLQHCVLCSSSDWVINTPDKALGFILADEGYDVWLGNARGNTYSRNHTLLSPSDKKFWKFSWDEIAYYDMPASIDYVLKTTNSTDLNYAGFSMGTLVLFAMISEKPHYNDKVKLMIALGPVAFLDNMGGPLAMVTRYSSLLKSFTDFFGIYEVLSGGIFLDLLTSIMCDPAVTTVAPICDNVLLRLIGFDAELANKRLLPKILAHTPAGTSVQNMIHFMQATNSGRFQKFNYGVSGNRLAYDANTPPKYYLERTTVPVALFWSENDWFANTKDVSKLYKLLPNAILNKKIPDKSFSHVDFLWSDTAVDLVYGDILKLLHDYNN